MDEGCDGEKFEPLERVALPAFIEAHDVEVGGSGDGKGVQLRGRSLRGAILMTRSRLKDRTVIQTFSIPHDLEATRLDAHDAASSAASVKLGVRMRPVARWVLR